MFIFLHISLYLTCIKYQIQTFIAEFHLYFLSHSSFSEIRLSLMFKSSLMPPSTGALVKQPEQSYVDTSWNINNKHSKHSCWVDCLVFMKSKERTIGNRTLILLELKVKQWWVIFLIVGFGVWKPISKIILVIEGRNCIIIANDNF